jgi:hypothetical protein
VESTRISEKVECDSEKERFGRKRTIGISTTGYAGKIERKRRNEKSPITHYSNG